MSRRGGRIIAGAVVRLRERGLAVIAGIDEAGYGPLLGPLVVTAAALEVPDDALDADLWRVLPGAVSRKPSKRPGRVAIGDSKKLYHRKRPKALEHLERGVLAMLATRGVRVGSLRDLLRVLAPGAIEPLAGYPWYAGADPPLPRCVTATDVALAGNALAAGMARARVRLGTMRSEVVFAGEFNRTVGATRNKSTTLFDVTGRLLARLWGGLWRQRSPGRVRIYADRHGGRIRYLAPLQRLFAGCEFQVLEEGEARSRYRIADARRELELCFGTDFDRHHLPVALASMACKYLRELFMELLNDFWARHVAELAPTAGYYTDGRRFLREIAPAARRLDLAPDLLRRCR